MPEAMTLSQYALSRLQKVAKANKLPPEGITMQDSSEAQGMLLGEMTLQPKVEVSRERTAGAKGNRSRHFNSVSELQGYVAAQEARFKRENSSWVNDVLREIEKLPGKGWGSEPMRVVLDDYTEYLTVTEICPACQGQGGQGCAQCRGTRLLACVQCQGNRQERCTYCYGTGKLQDESFCSLCRGTGWQSCRQCGGRGEMPCPSCNGMGNVSCTTCKGQGKTTVETQVTYGADTTFKTGSGSELLPAIRRCLDRIGTAALGQGHADITYEMQQRTGPGEPVTLGYMAQFLFSEMVVTIGKKKAKIVAFGKKALLLDVPPFLDSIVKTALASLEDAPDLSAALRRIRAWAVCDTALRLLFVRKTGGEELMRAAPVGLSIDAANALMSALEAALNRLTERGRLIGALLGTISGLMVACIPLALPQMVTMPFVVRLATEFLFPLLGGYVLWVFIGQAARVSLKQTFVEDTVALKQRAGKIAFAAELGYVALFLLISFFGSHRPAWTVILLQGYGAA